MAYNLGNNELFNNLKINPFNMYLFPLNKMIVHYQILNDQNLKTEFLKAHLVTRCPLLSNQALNLQISVRMMNCPV